MVLREGLTVAMGWGGGHSGGEARGGGDEARRLQFVLRNALTQAERDEARRKLLALSGHGTVRETAEAPWGRGTEALVFVLDVSGSMTEPDIAPYRLAAAQRATLACARVKAERFPGDRVAVVSFNLRAWVVLPWTDAVGGRDEVNRAVWALAPHGGTDIAAGLRAAGSLFANAGTDCQGRIVLLTDGHGGEPIPVAAGLKTRGIVIDVVGVGGDPRAVNEGGLRQVASTVRGDNRYRFISGCEDLFAHFRSLGDRLAR